LLVYVHFTGFGLVILILFKILDVFVVCDVCFSHTIPKLFLLICIGNVLEIYQ